MTSYLALILGAIIGASLRYYSSLANIFVLGLPFSTIIVNILGSSLEGFFLIKVSGTTYIFLYIGLFGSFTTMSSFNMELLNLLHDKLLIKAFIFFILNIFVSFLFFYIFYLASIKLEN